jgi:hypothetical protein
MSDERDTGIKSTPTPGTEAGSLNPISKKVMVDRIDLRTADIFSSAKKAGKDQYAPDTLSKRGEWKGVVLRVEPPPELPFAGVLAKFYEAIGIMPPVLVRIKARIPELHAGIPEPSQMGSTPGPHQFLIDMHPTYVAKDDTLPVPAVGSIVNLDYEDKQNLEGPKYTGAVGEQAQNLSAGGGPGDQAMSAAYEFARTGNCGPLGAMGAMGGGLGMSAGSYSSTAVSAGPVDNARRTRYVEQLLRLGGWPDRRQGDDAFEQIPFPLVQEIILNGEIGLLALFIGAGNWGISELPDALVGQDPLLNEWPPGTGIQVPDTDAVYDQAESAGKLPERSWPGKRASSGKHVMDGPGGPNLTARGGIGIAHFDSAAMEHFYEHFGPSPVPDNLKELSYDQLKQRGGEPWENWKRWCIGILLPLESQVYMINYWVRKFFELERNGGDIAKTVVNSRVQNSVSGVGGRLAGQSIEDQIQGYFSYKLDKNGREPGERGQGSAERAVRQAFFALRVVKCLEHILATVPGADITIQNAMAGISAPAAAGTPAAGPTGATTEAPSPAVFELYADFHVIYEGYISGWSREADSDDWEPTISTTPPYGSATLPSRGDEIGWRATSATFAGVPATLPERVFGPESEWYIPEGAIGYTIPANIPVYIRSFHPSCTNDGLECNIVGTEPIPNLDSPLINPYPDHALLNMQTSVVFTQNEDFTWNVYNGDTGVYGRQLGENFTPAET